MKHRIAVPCSLLALACVALADPTVVLPLDRAAYIAGEKIPLAVRAAEGEVKVELVGEGGPALLVYRGKPTALVMNTDGLAAGKYALHVNSQATGVELTLASPIRKSPGAITDESVPGPPQLPPEVSRDPAKREPALAAWRDTVPQTFRETGIDATGVTGEGMPLRASLGNRAPLWRGGRGRRP